MKTRDLRTRLTVEADNANTRNATGRSGQNRVRTHGAKSVTNEQLRVAAQTGGQTRSKKILTILLIVENVGLSQVLKSARLANLNAGRISSAVIALDNRTDKRIVVNTAVRTTEGANRARNATTLVPLDNPSLRVLRQSPGGTALHAVRITALHARHRTEKFLAQTLQNLDPGMKRIRRTRLNLRTGYLAISTPVATIRVYR
jgi:hypothetical protein